MALMARSIKSTVVARRLVLAQTSSSVRYFGAAVERRPFRRSLDSLDDIKEANPTLDGTELAERFQDLYPTAIIANQPNVKEAVLLPRAVHKYGASETSFWGGPFYFTSGDDWDQSWFGTTARSPWKRLFQMLVVMYGWFAMRNSGATAMFNGEKIVQELSKGWPAPEDKPIPPVTLPSK